MFRIIAFLCVIHLCESGKILVVFTVPEERNAVLGESLVKTLLEDGHEVTYVTPFPRDTKLQNLEFVDISTNTYDDLGNWQVISEVGNSSSLQMELIGVKLAEQALQHPNMKELMTNTSRYFDLVIAEWFYSGLLAPIASVFECPLIWYSPAEVSWKSISLVHSEITGLSETPPGLTMTERVHLMWSHLYLTAGNYFHFSSKELPAYEKSFRDAFEVRWRLLPNYEALVYNSSLIFINSHPPLGPRTALPLNAKYIGGHHLPDKLEPLPKNLKKVMDESMHGVIFVDLESNLIKNALQEHVALELIEAVGRMKQTVIWKCDEIMVNLPRNLYTIKKPPHHSILNHVNTVASINHGDIVSIIDATQYGVPIIGVPISEENYSNLKYVAERECGVTVEMNNELSLKILDGVNEIISNNAYRTNARTSQSIFRQRLTTPQSELTHWVKLIINTRGGSHLRSLTLKVTSFERYNLDVVLLLLMTVWFVTKVVKVCRVHLCTYEEDEADDKKEL